MNISFNSIFSNPFPGFHIHFKKFSILQNFTKHEN